MKSELTMNSHDSAPSTPTIAPTPSASTPWRFVRLSVLCLGLLSAGVLVGYGMRGASTDSDGALPSIGIPSVEALSSMATSTATEARSGDYSFFTYRRNLWIVRHSTGTARFFVIPETNTSEQRIEASNTYKLNPEEFPADQTRYQVSERNLSNYLWISNHNTGRSYFIRARRDGGFDESPIAEAGLSD